MILTILLLFFLTALVLIEIGLSVKYGNLLVVFAAMILVFTGILVLTTGIEIPTGTQIMEFSVTNTTLTTMYTNFDTGIYRSLGMILIGIGLYIFISAAMSFRERP